MSISSLMSLSTQAVFAAYRQVQTAANNIANANVEGYSRQDVKLETNTPEFTGNGWVGRGVTATTVSRATDTFLSDHVNALTAAAGTDAVRSTLMDQLQQVFGKTSTGLGAAATEVFSAYADLAVAPGDLSARQSVLGKLDDFASLARDTSQNIDALQAQAQNDIRNSVAEVNTTVRTIARLNVQIVNARALGHEPNDLLDQRERLVREISSQLEVKTVTSQEGSMAVFTAGGQTLVLGKESNQLVAATDPADPTRLTLGLEIDGGLTLMSQAVSGEGRLSGLYKFQNEDLVSARAKLGQMTASIAGRLNQQQALGLDLGGQAGALLMHVPEPEVVPHADNPVGANGQPLAAMTVTVTDPSALKASDYALAVDAANPGQFTLTRLSDGLVRSGLASGAEVDGVRIEVGDPAPSGGEKFLLRTVSQVSGALQLALRNPLGLAAANPVTVSANSENGGTMGVSSVTVRQAPASGSYATVNFHFTSDTGDYEVLDASGNSLGSGTYQAGEPLQYDGVDIALSGVPRSGDTLTMKPTQHVANGNGNALALAAFGTANISDGHSVADTFAALLSDMGVRAQGAQASAASSTTALSRASSTLSGEVGVNIDEEAAKLIQFQQNYQAAAKVLQTAQTLLDTMIQLAR